jgi:serine O-acetyltransferase
MSVRVSSHGAIMPHEVLPERSKARFPPAADAPRSSPVEMGGHRRRDLDSVIAELRQSREITHNIRHGGVARRLPSRTALAEIVNGIATALFPTHYGEPDLGADDVDDFVRARLKSALAQLEVQIRLSLPLSASVEATALAAAQRVAQDIALEFASQLPDIRALLVSDLRAAYESDPGASSIPEILLGYPGMVAMICYRIARVLHLLGEPLIARLIALTAHSRTGIDIHPGAEIGEGFSMDHGTGIVIGETSIIGRNVRLCGGVTLGANRLPPGKGRLSLRGAARHPVIEDDVFVFAGATLLGRLTVGAGSVIGGNVWLTRSVPRASNITQPQPRGLGVAPLSS